MQIYKCVNGYLSSENCLINEYIFGTIFTDHESSDKKRGDEKQS